MKLNEEVAKMGGKTYIITTSHLTVDNQKAEYYLTKIPHED